MYLVRVQSVSGDIGDSRISPFYFFNTSEGGS